MNAPPPHYLRLARALALVSGLAATGCAAAVATPGDATPDSADAADAPDARDAPDAATCRCQFGGGPTSPTDPSLPICTSYEDLVRYQCAVPGPLPPPELPA